MNGIEYIAKILKAEGVEALTCFPTNPLIEEAAKEGIRTISFRHERGAVMAADGFSRVSDRQRFGVVVLQAQAGAENAMGGLAQAYADNIPILVLPGGIPLSQMGVRPNFPAVHKYQGWVKQVEAIYAQDQIGNVMRRAFHALRSGSPGPIVVELTDDVCKQEVPDKGQNYNAPRAALQM
ncbi:MAG: thiamine pyrophosphate-binding protein, partial [SAR324 cluster bacterium]|nr:thiamine pyrophosphate-binding protein [SAR324 cluster bacterium]